MKFFSKSKGAVSIFLVIILVPMLTVTSLFVDVSKVKLARSSIESTGDLTLNTALTNYDTMLNDLYGLFATAQDMDQLFFMLEDYYKTCITSSGVGDEEAQTYVDDIMLQLGLVAESGDTSDLLNMELVDFNARKYPDASLANATIMKKQIVEFMKYRGPIKTGQSFLTALTSFSTLSEETKLVDKRTKYYKAEESMLGYLKAAWDYIEDYDNSSFRENENYIEEMKFDLENNITTQYKESIHKKTVKDLYDTQDKTDYYYRITKDNLSGYNYETVRTMSSSIAGGDIWKFETDIDSQLPTFTKSFNDKIGDFNTRKSRAINHGYVALPELNTPGNAKSKMNNFYNKYQAFEDFKENHPDITTSEDGSYDLQYLVQGKRAGLDEYSKKLKEVYEAYQEVISVILWNEYVDKNIEGYRSEYKEALIDEDMEEDEAQEKADEIDQTINDYKNRNEAELKNYKTNMIEVNDSNNSIWSHYKTISSKYDDVMEKAKPIIQDYKEASMNLPSGITDTSTVNSSVNQIATKINDIYISDLQHASSLLYEANLCLGNAKTIYENDVINSRNSWYEAADSENLNNSSLARQDRAEINDLKDQLNVAALDELANRLTNVTNSLNSAIEEINKYKYGGDFIGEITTYDDIKSLLEDADEIGKEALKAVPIIETDLNKKTDEWFEIQWEKGDIDGSWIKTAGNQADLSIGEDNEFYKYLHGKFYREESAENQAEIKEKAESDYKDLKEATKESTAENTDKVEGENDASESREIKGRDALPTENIGQNALAEAAYAEVKTGDEAAGDTSESLGDMFSSIGAAVKGMATGFRDRIYISDYIMSMFSHDTVEAEYEKAEVKPYEGGPRTMRLTPINEENNFAYKREVEYIIYGDTNSKNVAKAYGSIYGIRLGFNLVYAFTDSEIRDGAFAAATPISAATLGVIPVPLIQAAIIIGLACCESGLDITELKAGEAVPLFKNKETWRMSISGISNYAKGIAEEILIDAGGKVIDEATKKITEILDLADEDLDEILKDGTDEITGYVENAYNTTIERHANVAIQKLTTLATKAVDEAVIDPGIDAVAYVEEGLDDWLAQEAEGVDTSSDIAYLAKVEAVKIIKNGFIQKIVDSLEGVKKGTEDALSEITGKIEKIIGEIRFKIIDGIENATGKIADYKGKMLDEVKVSLTEGADSLKETLNEQMSGMFGEVSSDGIKEADNTGISSLLSFTYSDYLRLFVLIALYASEEGVLLRTADVIQVNMAHVTGEEGYLLSESAVYVDISATVQVKPTLLALPLFSEVEGNPTSESNWYTIEYEGIRGY